MNIWYINHYATPPEYGVPGRPYNLAKHMARLGHNVIIFCASHHHLRKQPALSRDIGLIKKFNGVRYCHLPCPPYQGNGFGRLKNMLVFSSKLRSAEAVARQYGMPPPDVLIPSCVHPFVFPPAQRLARKFGAKLIYEVRDLWPLSLHELSGMSKLHPLYLWLQKIEKKAYREADAVVSFLPKALLHMQPLGLTPEKFNFIPNGISRDEWEQAGDPLPQQHQETFNRLRQKKKLIVVYTGAHGPPNALEQVLDLGNIHSEDRSYHFVFIGEGVSKRSLQAKVAESRIDFVTFLPKVSKSQVTTALRQADVCFIGFQETSLYRFGISPNKLGEYLVSGKPIVCAVQSGNDPVQEAGAGMTVEPFNAQQLHKALLKLHQIGTEQLNVLGERGRSYALANLEWENLARKYARLCATLVGEHACLCNLRN